MNHQNKVTCHFCGKIVAAAKFCGNCGEKLQAAKVTRDAAEYRHLTVVFCDLVGSTQLSEQIDAEQYRELLSTYQHMASECIANYEGHIAQYLGDGVLIYFGYPIAHEDDPRRSIMAAMDLLEGIEKINKTRQYPTISVRIGIHAGTVVAGKVGVGASKEDLALGLAPNVAARLQSVAKPGTIVVSEIFRNLVEGFFMYEDLGPHEVKGIAEPISLFSVIGVDTLSRHQAASMRGLTPFVGREREVQQLSRLWEKSRAGEFAVALIGGEGGIGKSRLTRLISGIALQSGARFTDCECSPLHRNTVLFPLIELFNTRILRLDAEFDPESKLDRLEEFVNARGLDPSTAIPLLAALLNIEFESRYQMPPMGPELQREATLNLLLEIVARVRECHLMIFEDLQWADATTLEFVRRLIEERPLPSLMIVVNARPEFKAPWSDNAISNELHLERLSVANVSALINEVAGLSQLQPGIVEQIAESADGIPLYAEELTKSVLEANRDGHIGDRQDQVVPETLSASLMARLDNLGNAKIVAQVAAVFGRRFHFDHLSAISDSDDEELKKALNALVHAGILKVLGMKARATYQFNHSLIQVAAYDSLLRSARTILHGKVVARFESDFKEVVATQPELLARHSQLAGLAAKSIDYWMQAGLSAFTRSANIEATAHLRSGRELLKEIDDLQERARRELMLLSVLGPSLIATTGFASDEVGQVYDRARELCDPSVADPETFPVLAGSWVFFLVKGDLDTSRKYAEEMLQLAEQTADDNLLVEAHYSLGNSFYWLGRLDDARIHLDKADSLYDPTRHHDHVIRFGQDPGVTSRCYQSFNYWMLGNPNKAWEAVELAVSTAEPLNHPFTTAWPMAFYVVLYSHRREPDNAMKAAEGLIAFALKEHQVFWLQAAIIVRGWAIACNGNVEAGITSIREGIAAYSGAGARVSLPHFHGLLVEVLIANGMLNDAEQELDIAFVIAAKNGERVAEIGLTRQRAELALARGNKDVARDSCLEAVRIASETNAAGPGLRAAVLLHKLIDGKSDSPLPAFLDKFDPDTETRDLAEARMVLKRLAS